MSVHVCELDRIFYHQSINQSINNPSLTFLPRIPGVCLLTYLSPGGIGRPHEFNAVLVKDMEHLIQHIRGWDSTADTPVTKRQVRASLVIVMIPACCSLRRSSVLDRKRFVFTENRESRKHKNGLNVVGPNVHESKGRYIYLYILGHLLPGPDCANVLECFDFVFDGFA